MFPDDATLMELGRIAIVSARLDGALARLLEKLDRRVVYEKARRWPTSKLIKQCSDLAAKAPVELRDNLLDTIAEADKAQEARHVMLHSEWVMVLDLTRGLDPKAVLEASDEQLQEWASDPTRPQWGTYNARTDQTADAPSIEELRAIVRALENATGRLHARWVELPLREYWTD